jgi:hypothetical protein
VIGDSHICSYLRVVLSDCLSDRESLVLTEGFADGLNVSPVYFLAGSLFFIFEGSLGFLDNFIILPEGL